MGQLSIRARLTLAYTIAFGILLGLLSVGLYRTAAARLYAQVDTQIAEAAATSRPLFNISQSQVTWLVDKKLLDQSSSLVAQAIFNDTGQFLDGSALAGVYNLGFTEAGRHALETRSPTWETLTIQNDHRLRALNLTVSGSDGRLYLVRSGMLLDQIEDDLRQLVGVLASLVPLILLMGGLVGWLLASDALRPVAAITATARQITASNLNERLPLRGTRDELDRLSATLNEMIARLQDSFEQMSHFLSNVSHELRTPLAALRGSCEMAVRSAKSEEECRAVLADNIEELDRLAHTVSDLLALARAEAGQTLLKRRTENLAELVRDAVESARVLATERGVSIDCQTDSETTLEFDPEHLLRLLINLLDNAIKYNQPNGRVEVQVKTVDNWAVVSIADTGRGIASEDLPHIFDRFYRGEGATSAGGTGLGLSLARWVATEHGGRIEVNSQPGNGSTFRLWLPTKPGAALGSAPQTGLTSQVSRGRPSPKEKAGPSSGSLEIGWLPVNSLERRTIMLQHIVRWSYWLGIACGVITLLWRGFVAVGFQEYIQYGERQLTWNAFLNGAVLFLLIAAATGSYLSTTASKQ